MSVDTIERIPRYTWEVERTKVIRDLSERLKLPCDATIRLLVENQPATIDDLVSVASELSEIIPFISSQSYAQQPNVWAINITSEFITAVRMLQQNHKEIPKSLVENCQDYFLTICSSLEDRALNLSEVRGVRDVGTNLRKLREGVPLENMEEFWHTATLPKA